MIRVTIAMMALCSALSFAKNESYDDALGNTGTGQCDIKDISHLQPGEQATVTVNAKAILSFRFNTALVTSVTGDPDPTSFLEEGYEYCPTLIRLPEYPSSVVIHAKGNWKKGPTFQCGPEGENFGAFSAPWPRYLRDGIALNKMPSGALTGMFSDETSAPGAGLLSAHYVGKSSTLPVPVNGHILALGFADGFQWSNNEGTVEATITIGKH